MQIYFSYLFISFLAGKGCCVLLKTKWHENGGASIILSVRQKGVKDFVDIVETEKLIKNVSSKFL